MRPPGLPHPVVSLMLVAAWLLLSRSLAPGHWALALLLGWGLPLCLHRFLPRIAPVRLMPALRLTLVVLRDIVVSNLVVARQVLGPPGRLKPQWVQVPLASRHPYVNALLATIVTTTPGTLSAVVADGQGWLAVHILSTDDAGAVVADIQRRYEAPLLAIFGVAVTDGGQAKP